ncbi:hypothetical protein [Microbacterium sp. LWH12-1.2]|uniref:hypothetical protein n=1 Tax=Microbacterium sp. LWH12-1.2 TaxID=3135259 RepID=UPI003412CAEC
MRRAGIVAALIAGTLLLGGCGGLSDTGEPLTVEQSEQLAQTRFQLSTAGELVVDATIGDPAATDHVTAALTVDTGDHLAWGTIRRGPAELAVEQRVLLHEDGYALESAGRWQSVSWSEGDLGLLLVVFSLATDRPENAQLLRQSDARYLGSEDGLDVYRLPSPDGAGGTTRLWLDGGLLARFDDGGDALVFTVDREATPEPVPSELSELVGTDD